MYVNMRNTNYNKKFLDQHNYEFQWFNIKTRVLFKIILKWIMYDSC